MANKKNTSPIAQAQTTAQRVQALRQRRDAEGLVRLELYAHPLDHAAIKAFAATLQQQHHAERSA